MARINIEDQFWIDIQPVARKLGEDIAIGQTLRLFRLAQERIKRGQIVTDEDWTLHGFSEALVPIFAKKVDGGYDVAGSKKHFEWLKERAEAGRKGGQNRATAHLNETNDLAQANASKRKQTQASYSSSSSFSNTLKPNTCSDAPLQKDPFNDHMKLRISEAEVKERVFKKYPIKRAWGGAWPLIRSILAAHPNCLGDIEKAVENYSAEMRRLQRPEDKIKSLPNFFENDFWRDYVNPEPNQDFSKGAIGEQKRSYSEMAKELWECFNNGSGYLPGWFVVTKLDAAELRKLPRDDFRHSGPVPGLIKRALEGK